MDPLFFEILQVSVGHRNSLSRCPSSQEWLSLFETAKNHTVIGIAFYGVQHLPKEQITTLPTQLKMQWLGIAAQIQKRNEVMNSCTSKLQKQLVKDGIRCCVLKGQGVAAMYGSELASLRQSGDIDLYVDCSREGILKYLSGKDIKYGNWDFLHIDAKFFENIEVEVHYRPSLMRNIISNYHFQKFIGVNKDSFFKGSIKIGENRLTIPVTWLGVFYLLHHTFRHMLTEGVGLRQVMDCYFAIKSAVLSEEEIKKLVRTINHFKMKRFVCGLLWVIETVFSATEIGDFCKRATWVVDEKEGKFILNEIMISGNFGHSDNRYSKGNGKTGKVIKVFRRSVHLMTHYPSEALAAPFYYGWHFCWKKSQMYKAVYKTK